MKIPTVKTVSISSILFFCQVLIFAQPATKLGDWTSIEAFDINESEDYLIVAMATEGKGKLYELSKVVFGWTEPHAIDSINNYLGGGHDIGGPFLSADGKRLYFHANFPDSKGGYDIYYSDLTPKGWGKPVNMGSAINRESNQLYPSIAPGESKILYATSFGSEYEFKKPKTSPDCQKFISSNKNPDNTWGEPYFVHQVINAGCQYSPVLAKDGKTIYYASVDEENQKLGYQLMSAVEHQSEFWMLPKYIAVSEELEGDKLNPRFANGKVYFLRCYKEKKDFKREINFIKVEDDFFPKKTLESKGKILTKTTNQPIEASLTVFNPTTLKVLGRYNSDKYTGEFNLCFADEANYIVDIRKYGYSFATYTIDYREPKKISMPAEIRLFDTIELQLNVFDSEIFSPLKVQASASMVGKKDNIIEASEIEKGVYNFELPLGSDYNISAFADWFDQNEFVFKLEGDIVFSKFNRTLPLTPQKNIFSIITTDSETGAVFIADGYLVNLTSDEPPIFFTADDVDENGNINIKLRKGDKYELNLNKNGYFFHSQTIDLQQTAVKADSLPIPELTSNGNFALQVAMDSLREDKAITLNNITFDYNSVALSSDSFKELDKVVKLINDNPDIFIEISAHTDNIGTLYYNQILSDNRAQSVVNYLLENQVSEKQLIAKGYGFSEPKVANNTDENRAINRRVEFKVINKKITENEQ